MNGEDFKSQPRIMTIMVENIHIYRIFQDKKVLPYDDTFNIV